MRGRLASALESGLLAPPGSAMAVRATVGTGCEEAILGVLREWERLGVSAAAGAAWLRSLRLAAARAPAPDFVWTGPEVPGLHARDTRRVYEELPGSATRSIRASTYVFSDGPRAFKTLAERMDAVPELGVTLLLNIERRRGDTTAADSLVRRFADEFRGREWPGAARPKAYHDPRSVETGSPSGVLHAKAVVTDEQSVFITSANLTAAAQDHNIELGLLVHDRTLAATTVLHLRTLIERNLLHRLPSAWRARTLVPRSPVRRTSFDVGYHEPGGAHTLRRLPCEACGAPCRAEASIHGVADTPTPSDSRASTWSDHVRHLAMT